MPELVADRFLRHGAAWIDIATGMPIRLRLNAAETGSGAIVWNEICAELALLRHPLLNPLVDYGYANAHAAFEAYAVAGAVASPCATKLMKHVVRFLESRGMCLNAERSSLAMRHVCCASPKRHVPSLGFVLQRRRALAALEDLLADTGAVGVQVVPIAGVPGSGLRTLRLQAARVARLHGYIPVSATVLATSPWLAADFRERHVCLFWDRQDRREDRATAQFLASLGLQSARRHVVVHFLRQLDSPRALVLDRMGVTDMISMVYVDSEMGPAHPDVRAAACAADGHPGRFLASLGLSACIEHRTSFSLAHESSPQYVVEQPSQSPPRRPVHRRGVFSADTRALTLAARGRHAAAIRLLRRAARVLELRGNHHQAAVCAQQLGWILRDRGQSDAALDQFSKAFSLAPEGSEKLRSAIATGIAWTDECRFADAEAALRSAAAAAELVGDRCLLGRAQLALARCVFWLERFGEAAQLAEIVAEQQGNLQCRALALLARIELARGNQSRALAMAARAAEAGSEADVGSRLSGAYARGMAYVAVSDYAAAVAALRAGLAEAAAAHRPLAALRLRALLLKATRASASRERARLATGIRTALGRDSMPLLLRRQLEELLRSESAADRTLTIPAQTVVDDVQVLLEKAFGADDEREAVGEVCRALLEKLRASTVQVTTSHRDRRLLARAGRPWTGDMQIVERTLAGNAPCWSLPGQVREAASPITYASHTVGVLVCRWTATVDPDMAAAISLLRAGALAVAPSVRMLVEKPSVGIVDDPVLRDLIGSGSTMAAVRDAMTRAARAPYPVLIEGESGSGKELVARGIHRLSSRRDRRICAVNCAALSDDLLEAELFGHARGAFTGAIGERPGLFEEADGGTLFLDEIAELSQRAQAKLLRALQDGEVRRVGENFPRRVDARVMAATNRNLEQQVEAGRFRADLRFRLDVVRIVVPPLRERATDIPQLATHFWDEACRRLDSRATLTPETLVALTRYDWPGNVRQLQNVIAALAVEAPRRGRVSPSRLPAHIARSTIAGGTTFEAAREDFERRFVLAALGQTGGQRAKAARLLGVTRQGLAKMLRRLRIDPVATKARSTD